MSYGPGNTVYLLKIRVHHANFLKQMIYVEMFFNFNDRILGLVHYSGGPGSVVSIATAYRLDGPGIELRWG